MRRWISILLFGCLLLALATPAGAEASLKFASSAGKLLQDWLKENHPEISCEVSSGPSSTAEALALLESPSAPDIMMVQSSRVDIYALLQSGLLEDLSGSEEIRLGLAQMYQPFQDMVTDSQGAVYGVPYAVYSQAMHVIPSAWEAAGVPLADAPESLEELLDFAQDWIARVQEGAVGDVRLHTLQSCGYPMDDRRYTLWLSDLLLKCWGMRQRAADEPIAFDAPEFIALAQRVQETGQALAAAEERPGAASLSLYDNGFNRGMGYGLNALDSNAFPMRLTAGDPPRNQGSCWLFVVRKGSPYVQVCMDFLGNLICMTDPAQRRNVCLYREIPQQQFTSPAGEDGYVLLPQWVESYQPERLFFLCDPLLPVETYTLREELMLQFAKGDLSAQGLATELDQLLGGK